VVTLNLTINKANTGTDIQTACDSYTWIDGQTYTESNNTAVFTLTNAAGCDSVVTLNLTINKANESSEEVTTCDSYTWNGKIYTKSGSYSANFKNASGCDSTATLILTITDSSEETMVRTVCDQLTVNNITYTESGTYIQYLQNNDGCELTLTIELTILESTFSETEVTACDSYTWNGTTYNVSGIYTVSGFTNEAECDSTATLILTIQKSTEEAIDSTVCDQFVINGETYTESGIYTQKLTNVSGCDSTLTINLTIRKNTTASITEVACTQALINDVIYTESGIYTQKLTNTAGCDSTLTINLTIRGNEPPVIITEASNKTVECDGNGNTEELKEWLESIGGTGEASVKYGEVRWSNNFEEITDSCGATGSTTVTFTATDDCGNSDSTIATFTIEDKTAPVIICPENIVINVNADEPDAIINIELPSVSDNCGSASFINNYNGSTDASDSYPIGSTTVVYTATDECGNTSACEFTVTVVCEGQTRIAGVVNNQNNNMPIENAMVILIPQNQTSGAEQLRITNIDGEYAFTGMVPGDYLVQVMDANLNAQGLYPVASSLFFTKIEDCVFQNHDFDYGKSSLPVIGDFVWYDLNGNGIQDEWFDANNDDLVTQNFPDANGVVDFNKWEWIDLNGDGKSSGPENEGELNKAGFGNASNSNILVTGPNNYNSSVIIGYTGYWRERPAENVWGEYLAELNLDENLTANAKAIGSTGLVKILPESVNSEQITGSLSNLNNQNIEFNITTKNPISATLSVENPSNLDLDFGIRGAEEVPEMILADDKDTSQMNIPVTIFVKNNDIEIPAESVITTPSKTTIGGTITVNSDGSVTYTPPTDFLGEDKFDYTITTPDGRIDSATVTVLILAPADLTIEAVNDEFEIFNDEVAEGSIIVNDINPVGEIVISTTPEEAPENGLVSINPDGTIVYTPNAGFSGIDSFSYRICNSIVPTLCDEAVVTIYVLDTDTINPPPVTPCEIFIPNGFSPNDDGINDYFVVDCIEELPNVKVEIFNRWGNLVFEKENYGNIDRWGNVSAWWDGTSTNGLTVGKDKLPAGTYFYILNFNDGAKEPKAGSIFLNR
jgi:gliding motility-associated-like protein